MCQHISECVSSGCPRRLIFSHLLLSSFLVFRLSRGVEAWNADCFVCSRRLSRYRSVNMWKLAAFLSFLFHLPTYQLQPKWFAELRLRNQTFWHFHSVFLGLHLKHAQKELKGNVSLVVCVESAIIGSVKKWSAGVMLMFWMPKVEDKLKYILIWLTKMSLEEEND